MIIIKNYHMLKSAIEWEKFVNPVNRLVHPAGLKFSDTYIEVKLMLE